MKLQTYWSTNMCLCMCMWLYLLMSVFVCLYMSVHLQREWMLLINRNGSLVISLNQLWTCHFQLWLHRLALSLLADHQLMTFIKPQKSRDLSLTDMTANCKEKGAELPKPITEPYTMTLPSTIPCSLHPHSKSNGSVMKVFPSVVYHTENCQSLRFSEPWILLAYRKRKKNNTHSCALIYNK